MKILFNWLIIVSAIVMILTILLQTRGSGLGAVGGETGGFVGKRRGGEKVLFQVTILAAIVFVLSVVFSILSQ